MGVGRVRVRTELTGSGDLCGPAPPYVSVSDPFAVTTVASPSPLLSAALSERAASAELRDFRGCASLSTRAETEMLRMSARRRDEFVAGRLCAAAALGSLGLGETSVGREAGGAPIWPTGFVGSISHTDDIAVAVAAPASTIKAIGLDIEQIGAVKPEIWPLLFTEAEQSHLRETDPCARDAVATALFAAKEAFYKAQWPITREWLDFLDVEISLNGGAIAVSPRSHKTWVRRFGTLLSGSLAGSANAIAAVIFAPSV